MGDQCEPLNNMQGGGAVPAAEPQQPQMPAVPPVPMMDFGTPPSPSPDQAFEQVCLYLLLSNNLFNFDCLRLLQMFQFKARQRPPKINQSE